MKKHWIILLVCVLVAAAICLVVSWPNDDGGVGLPGVIPTRPRPTNPTLSGPTDSAPPADGVVVLYVCGREDLATYEALAQRYTQQTGVECRILTGDLAQQMTGEQIPTIFCVHSREEATQWAEYMLDLSGSAVLAQLSAPAFAMEIEGKQVGLAMDAEGYGLIYNAGLLGASGFTRADITDYTSLRTAVELITINCKEQGFHAFAQTQSGDTNFAQYMMGLSRDPAAIRWFVDLYAANDTINGPPLTQFLAGKAVFYLGGVGEYDQIASMGIHNLDILPLYTQDGGGLHWVCDTYWSVNGRAGEADIQESLAFLNWLVSAGEDGTVPVDSLGWFAPFAKASGADNPFERLLRRYIARDEPSVCWELTLGMPDQALAALADALTAYAKNPTDDLWAKVEALLG